MQKKYCKNCGDNFETKNLRKVFCKDKCQRQHYKKSPQGKLKDKIWRQSSEGKKWWKKYKKSSVWKKCNENYQNGDSSKERYKRYRKSEKRKIVYIRYLNSKPEVRIAKNLRGRLNKILNVQKNTKKDKTLNLVGCSATDLKIHLEKNFKNGMNWSNYGVHGWHIDHIYPCSKFDLSKLEEQKKCFHFTNLKPEWAIDNIKKSNKIIIERSNYVERKKAS